MRHEPNVTEFRIRGVRPSLRNERKEAIRKALTRFNSGAQPKVIEVDDYNFSHALKVWQAKRQADAYVCLSDQLAIGLAHLLQVSCPAIGSSGGWRDRLVGFDNSLLAQASGIASFDQGLHLFGKLAINELCRFFERFRGKNWPGPDQTLRWPIAKQPLVPGNLATNGT
jgi:DNA-binding LacI/PurR family transcriptional regulator